MKSITKRFRKTALSLMLCCGLVTVGAATVLATRGDPTEAVQAKADETVYYLTDGTSSTLTLSDATIANANCAYTNSGYVSKYAKLDQTQDTETGFLFTMPAYSTAPTVAKMTFGTSVSITEVGSLVFRMYLNGQTASNCLLMLYSPQSTARWEATHYSERMLYMAEFSELLPEGTSAGWVDLELSTEEASKLVDESGNISGVQLTAMAGGPTTTTYPSVFLDYVGYKKSTTNYNITFDYNEAATGIAPVTKLVNVTDFAASLPANSFGYEVEGYYTDSTYTTQLDLSNTGITEDTTVYAKMVEYTLPDYYLTDGTSASASLSVTKTSGVNGSDAGLNHFTPNFMYDSQTGVKVTTLKGGVWAATITFLKSVPADKVDTLTFRMYLRGESSNTNAIELYAPQDTNQSTKVSVSHSTLITSGYDGWVDVTLTRAQATQLADSEGNISGVQLAARTQGYSATGNNTMVPFVLLDYVSYVETNTVFDITFDYNQALTGQAPVTQAVDVEDFEAGIPDVTCLGYTVEGYYTDSAYTQALDLSNTGITGATTVYAKMVEYVLPDYYLTDGTKYSVALSEATVTNLNGSTALVRFSFEDYDGQSGLKLATAKSAGYIANLTFQKSVAVNEVGSLTLRLYLGGIGANGNKIALYSLEATDRYDTTKCVEVAYADLLTSGYDGWVTLTIANTDAAKLADSDGKIAGLQFCVIATGYTDSSILAAAPFAFLDYVCYEESNTIFDITFDYNQALTGQAPVTAQVDVANLEASLPDVTCLGYFVEGWYKDSSYTQALDLNDTGITEATTIYAKMAEYVLPENYLTDGTANSLQLSEATMTSNVDGGSVGLARFAFADYDGQSGLKFSTAKSAVYIASLTFGKSVTVDSVSSLTFRMYIYGESKSESQLMIYAPQATERNGTTMNYKKLYTELLPADTWNGWVSVTLSRSEALELADASGNISGIQLAVMATKYENTSNASAPFVFLDYVSYETMVEGEQMDVGDDFRLKVYLTNPDATVSYADSALEVLTDDIGSYVEISLVAKQVMDDIDITIDGQIYTTSIAKYLHKVIAKEGVASKNGQLALAVLEYTANLQKVFGYNDTNVANDTANGMWADSADELSAMQSAISAQVAPTEYSVTVVDNDDTDTIRYRGVSLQLNEKMNLVVAFNGLEGYTVKVGDTVYTPNTALGEGLDCIVIEGVNLAQMDSEYTVTVEKDGAVIYSVTVSAMTYVQYWMGAEGANANLVAVCQTLNYIRTTILTME